MVHNQIPTPDQTYRARRRAQDLAGYRAECAARARSWRERNAEHYSEYRKNNLRHHSNAILGQARKKSIPVSIEKEDLEAIMVLPCFYCGFLHEKGFGGADRVNNNRGYSHANLVPCCTLCNMAKGALDPLTFYERCCHIAFHRVGGDPAFRPFPNAWSANTRGLTHAGYQYRAIRKGVSFDLDASDHAALETTVCTHCGANASSGWDRVDADGGYVKPNVVPSCADCNFLRRALSIDAFYDLCARVARHMVATDALARARSFGVPRTYSSLSKRIIESDEADPDPEDIDSDDDFDVAVAVGLFGDPADLPGPSDPERFRSEQASPL